MNVLVNGKSVSLSPSDLLGSGGEGNVFAYGTKQAIKVYHTYSPDRGRKLAAMIARPPQIDAARSTLPLTLVTNRTLEVVGFVMARIGTGYEELAQLASRKYRAAYHVTTRQVAALFLDGGATVKAIHASGYCIGDFNDFNEKFQGAAMLFLDVDAWQFGPFPCPVGAEQFLDPYLYGIDLSLKPVFTPENDWYSFAVLLFKSLLGVHPYGGTHRTVRTLTQRAKQGLTVMDPAVIYPQTGLPPDLLDDALAHTFWKWFKQNERGDFPLNLLREYAAGLVECPNCGATYPGKLKQCPLCSAVTAFPVAKMSYTLGVREVLVVNGTILFSKLVGQTLFVVSEWQGTAFLTRYVLTAPLPVTDNLGVYVPGTRYEVFDNLLVTNPPHSDTLSFGLTTDSFSGTRQALFRASERSLFRLMAGQLLYGRYVNGLYSERVLRPVSVNQTWFTVRQQEADKPTVCGFFQVFREQKWWLIFEGLLYDDLALTPLEVGESQTDVLVRFDSQGAIILRSTQLRGTSYRHYATVTAKGQAVNLARRSTDEPLPHGALYAHGVLLYGSDDGLVQAKDGAVVKLFDQTKGVIDSGDTIYESENGLLAVKSDRVLFVHLG